MKPNKKQLAKDLFLQTDKTRQEIADILGINRKTVYNWMQREKWEEMKKAALQAPGFILQNVYNFIQRLNSKIDKRGPEDNCPTMDEVNMLNKLINMSTKLKVYATGSYIQVLEQLVRYVYQTDTDLAAKIVKISDRMIRATVINEDYYATATALGLPIPITAPTTAPTIADITVNVATSAAIAFLLLILVVAYIIRSMEVHISSPTMAPVINPAARVDTPDLEKI